MKGKLADNEVQNQQLEEKIQSLTENSASMVDLLRSSDDATSPVFQDKMKKLAENFKKYSTSPIDARASTPGSVRSEVPAQVAPTNNTATSVSTPLPQVTPVQRENQQADVGDVGDISPLNISDQMKTQEHMEVEPNTSSLPPNEHHTPPLEEGEWEVV